MRRYLILAASMGDGHLRVAGELQRRLALRGDTAEVVDILELLPFRIGPALRSGYAAMLRHAPSVYDLIYRGFFTPKQGLALRPDPLVVASTPAVARLISEYRPDVVVSTFHLCGQIAGRLRAHGQLAVPSTVVVTDFVAHRMWLHPGNDAFVCPHPAVAADAAALTGRPAFAAAPAVGSAFLTTSPARSRIRAEFGLDADIPVVLLSAGAWGSGDITQAVEATVSNRHVTAVLCGRNEALRTAIERRHPPASEVRRGAVLALGWRNDLADVMRACDVLIENAGGQMAVEAMAVELPVVTFRPLPGHGRDGCRRMSELGLSSLTENQADLHEAIDTLAAADSPRRQRQIEAGRALFTADPVEFLDLAVVPT